MASTVQMNIINIDNYDLGAILITIFKLGIYITLRIHFFNYQKNSILLLEIHFKR